MGDTIKVLETVDWEDAERMSQAMREIDWHDPAQRRAVALVILKHVREDVARDNLMPLVADVENVPLGQTPQWTVRRGLKAYVHEPGSRAPRSQITTKVLTVESDLTSVNPESELAQLQAGRYGTIADIRRMAKDELIGTMYARVWNVMRASITTGANFFQLAGNTTTEKYNALVSGLDYADDMPGGPVKAIVGRRSVLGFIHNIDGYSQDTLSLRDKTILLKTFRGIPIVPLQQYQDLYGVNQISADSIMLVKGGTVKVARTQDVQVEESINSDELLWNAHFHERYGIATFNGERNVRIKFA